MTLWREHATPEELAEIDRLKQQNKANNAEIKKIVSRCYTRAWRKKDGK